MSASEEEEANLFLVPHVLIIFKPKSGREYQIQDIKFQQKKKNTWPQLHGELARPAVLC